MLTVISQRRKWRHGKVGGLPGVPGGQHQSAVQAAKLPGARLQPGLAKGGVTLRGGCPGRRACLGQGASPPCPRLGRCCPVGPRGALCLPPPAVPTPLVGSQLTRGLSPVGSLSAGPGLGREFSLLLAEASTWPCCTPRAREGCATAARAHTHLHTSESGGQSTQAAPGCGFLAWTVGGTGPSQACLQEGRRRCCTEPLRGHGQRGVTAPPSGCLETPSAWLPGL